MSLAKIVLGRVYKDKEEKTLPFKTIIITKIDQKVKNLNKYSGFVVD